ncbi:MAG TPA: hypothetical protein VGX23_12415 [Actinocrinis sp.]|nr:hypothetical protein [Actinocrinis sp.]
MVGIREAAEVGFGGAGGLRARTASDEIGPFGARRDRVGLAVGAATPSTLRTSVCVLRSRGMTSSPCRRAAKCGRPGPKPGLPFYIQLHPATSSFAPRAACRISADGVSALLSWLALISIMVPMVLRRSISSAAVLFLAAAVGFATRGCAFSNPPTAARQYLNSVKVSDYQRVATGDQVYSGTTDSTDIYVGPAVPGDALVKAISGPDVSVRVVNPAALGMAFPANLEFGLVILGGSPVGECGVNVDTFRTAFSPEFGWNLSENRKSRRRRAAR